jgi:hypothetical protein
VKNRLKLILAAAALAWLLAPGSADACAACFGHSDSPMAKGMNAGILALLAVIGTVLAGAASFFVFLARRAGTGAQPDHGGLAAAEKSS